MAEEISQNPDVSFRDVHPTTSARGKLDGKNLPAWSGLDGVETDYIRCKQCGFINKLSRTHKGSGWGNIENEWVTYYVTYDDSGNIEYIYSDPDVEYDGKVLKDPEMAGCSFCHSSEYI